MDTICRKVNYIEDNRKIVQKQKKYGIIGSI